MTRPPSIPWDETTNAAIHEHINADSAVELLLRGHLWAEAALRDGIAAAVDRPQYLRLDRWTNAQLIDLGLAVGAIPGDLELPMRRLNTLRNRLAHDVTLEVSDEEQGSDLFASLPPERQQFLRERMAADRGDSEPEGGRDQVPFLRYAIAGIVIGMQSWRQSIVDQKAELERRLDGYRKEGWLK